MTMFSRASFSHRAALIALFAAVCNAQTGASNSWGAAAKSPEIFTKSDLIEIGAPQSILLIGENHASVKTQTQLADLLDKLYQEQAVDAILVEGSNGKIDASDLRESLAKSGAKRTAEFWRGQLNLGQIAGYEYVALTRDGVRIWGVEDMDAKRRYTADAARRGAQTGLQDEVDLHRRALALSKDAIAPLDAGMRQGAGVDSAVKRYEGKIGSLMALKQTDGIRYAEAEAAYSDSIERVTALYGKLRPVLPAYDQAVKEVGPYNKLVERAKKLSEGGAPSLNDVGEDYSKLLTDLRAAKSRVEKASANFDTVSKKAGYAGAEAVLADLKQIQEAEDKITANTETINKLGERFGKLESELTDQFFVVANSVRTAAGRPIPALQNFLRDERVRARANSNDPEKPYLSDRDKYMVANTLAFLKSSPGVKRVALIIGYAHLDGMTKRLREQNVNILTGKIAASEEETEAWENRAWQRRSRPAVQIFSRSGRKEISRLLDETYKNEVPALLSRLETVSASGGGGLALGKTRTFEAGTAPGSRKAIVVTPDAVSLRADWGAQVVGLGTLPDGSGTHYLVVDRDLAQQEAKKLSNATTMFATAYRTKNAQGAVVTNFDLPNSVAGLNAFKSRVPRQGQAAPKRVVVAAEGDGRALNSALGGGAGEPPWTSRVARFTEPPEGRRPILFFTKNMRRASERLNAMDKQDPLKMGQIATFEMAFDKEQQEAGLGDLWFTPEAGDHARAYLIAGDNTPEFRQKLKEAADAGLLRNKQIALATCFDPSETEALRDMLLEGGALMVWSPENRISPDAARKLRVYMEKVDSTSGGRPVRGLDEYMDRALKLWYDESKDDPDLKQLLNSTNTAEVRTADSKASEAD